MTLIPLALLQDITTWIVQYILDNIATYVLGLITTLAYFLLRPRSSFWFAKTRIRLFRRGLVVNLDSLITVGIDEVLSDDPLKDLHSQFGMRFESEMLSSEQGGFVAVTVQLPERKIRFEGRLSTDEESGETYALKLVSGESVTYSSMSRYIEDLFNARDVLYEVLSQSLLTTRQLPEMTIGLSWKPKGTRLLQWLDHEHSLDGFIYLPDTDIRLWYGSGRASVSSVAYQPIIKDIMCNLVVESVIG